MLEEERNKYFEQARQATLAEIAGNQQAMLDNAAAEQVGTIEPAYAFADRKPMDNPQGVAGTQEGQLQAPANPTPYGEEQTPRPEPVPAKVGAYSFGALPVINGPTAQAETMQEPSGINGEIQMSGKRIVPGAEVQNPAGLAGYDKWLADTFAEAENRRKQAELDRLLDPRMQRAENSRKWIAGIGDALASIANMVGTGHGAANQKQTYMLPGVNEAIEQDRARRAQGYQKNLDRLNALEIQKAKNDAEAAKQAADLEYKTKKDDADRAFNREKWEADTKHKQDQLQRQLDQDKFNNDLNTRKQEENERHNRSQESINWYKAKKGDNGPGEDDGNGSGSRFTGKRGGGMKEAKLDYNSMLNIIAEDNGCENWADLTNRAKNDRTLRAIYNQFDLGKDKAGAAKIEGMISSYAKDYAPDFYEHYFGRSAGDGNIDFNAYKTAGAGSAAAPSGGTLSGIMSSNPQGGKKKKNK